MLAPVIFSFLAPFLPLKLSNDNIVDFLTDMIYFDIFGGDEEDGCRQEE